MNANANTSGRHRRPEAVGPDAPAPAAARMSTRTRTGAIWRLRPRTVRAKIVTVLMVPVIALMALWGLAAVNAVRDSLTIKQVNAVDAQVRVPLDRASAALLAERTATTRYLTQPEARSAAPQTGRATLDPQTTATDSEVASVKSGRQSAVVAMSEIADPVRSGIGAVLADFDTLPALRDEIEARQIQAADAYDAYSTMIQDARNVDGALAATRSGHQASVAALAAVGFGLAAILVSLLISVRIGRGLVLELVGLRNSALDLAGRRLPAAISRLRTGESVDLDVEAPLPTAGQTFHGGDEVGQVADALAIVQRAAIEAAVERAEVVSGVAGVFLNLARRSQSLVHRQLMLLDAMERREDDPTELEDLFRLDHLATRMRRHAEGLIILSGAAPGRAWRRPVPLMDVVRAAAAEVEDFDRVDVRRMPRVRVVGGGVADLIHLVAELVENATMFSPPHARVTVRGEVVGSGCAVEIEDRGLGMGEEVLADANRRIALAQQADLFDSDRLGLFVISRLARRHGIRVTLRTSDYGGTIAVILLPASALEMPEDGDDSPITDLASVMGLLPKHREKAVAGRAGAERGGVGPHDVGLGDLGHGDLGHGDVGLDDLGYADVEPEMVRHANGGHRERAAGGNQDHAEEPENLQAAPVIGENGLPQRRRQTSIAPQLRTSDRHDQTAHDADGPDVSITAPTPDAARATMSAFQRGWTRGRDAEPQGTAMSDPAPDPAEPGGTA